jgi:hypothetical protein
MARIPTTNFYCCGAAICFISKLVENFIFDKACAPALQQAQPVRKQAMCKHMADARGCKEGDASAVKSEVFNQFRYNV